RVAFAQATILENVGLLAGGPAEVAADEAADGPAHGQAGTAEVQEMLLRLVRGGENRALLGERVLAVRCDTEQALARMETRSGVAPLCLAVPLELGLHGFGHPPAVSKAELREYGTSGRETEVLDEILAQKPHRDRVQEQRALSGEADY